MFTSPRSVPLRYSVVESTPHSGRYGPDNILVDNPLDQTSRWSGAFQGSTAKQWILLQLNQLSILQTITFGKFSKPHPCNMKDFRVFVGATKDNLVEVLHGGLRNDSSPETFPVRHINTAQVCFPTRFVKIVPLSAHGQNFHSSIWYISMMGIADQKYVERIYKIHEEHRENTGLRYILKHIRQRRLLTPYNDILSRAFTQVEHPLLTRLHVLLVLEGNWKQAEIHLRHISAAGLFIPYLGASNPFGIWNKIMPVDHEDDVPCPRSGHAMCMDYINEAIYLHGGYDGEKALDDLWSYHVKENRWQRLSVSTGHEINGPGPRSCHKMAFDAKTGNIYLLGRLTDEDATRSSNYYHREQEHGTNYCSEFFRYRTRGVEKGIWEYLNFDTAISGGPPLIYDHQMVVDSEAQILYVYGGRVLDGDWDAYKYSGLFSYNIRTGKWKLLHPANNIPPRSGHSMVLDPTSSTLFILAGQKEESYLGDMYAYNIATNTITKLFSNFSTAGGPNASYTQRAIIDTDLKEIYVFCGLITADSSTTTGFLAADLYNWVYRYGARPGTWARIRSKVPPNSGSNRPPEPCPRYAHEVVYNPKTKQIYMFGGSVSNQHWRLEEDKDNDSRPDVTQSRTRKVNDFWELKVTRPGAEDILRKTTYRIRCQQFRELCEDSTPTKALSFLQTQVSPLVNHDDEKETEDYRSLMTFLLAPRRPHLPLIQLSPEGSPALSSRSVSQDESRSEEENASKKSESSEDNWTNEIKEGDEDEDDEEDSDSLSRFQRLSSDLMRSVEDQVERDWRAQDGCESPSISADRYAQRTEVFESMMEYIAEWDKEPAGNLLDFVTRNDTRFEI